MEVTVKKDGEGYIAEVQGRKNLYAFGYTPEEALEELKNVIDMMVDYYSEEMIFKRKLENLW